MGWTVRSSTFPISITSRPALGSTQLPLQWVMGVLPLGVKSLGCAADLSLPPSVEVKNLRTSTTLVCLHGVIRGIFWNCFMIVTVSPFPRTSTGNTDLRWYPFIVALLHSNRWRPLHYCTPVSSWTARRRADDTNCCTATDEGSCTALFSSALMCLRTTHAQNEAPLPSEAFLKTASNFIHA